VAGLCRVANVAEIVAQAWSLNPGRYVGTEVEELEDEVFEEQLATAAAELHELGGRAGRIQAGVEAVLVQLLSK
jgi:type I restriction enzyme M protein